ncbi:serine hydrolase domain-containing protein [Kribbella sp. NPDC050124]|uniref:serine hydrolase domain-containing protein n=1 Tax=Kribbella sp. NPDC050124 TaxID=3364114 RepID=UPI003797D6DB
MTLPRSTPEAQGLSGAALDAFVAALDSSGQEIQTVMLLRHGTVVLEEEWTPYRLTEPHALFSVSKSFTSTAIGLAIDAGLLALDDKVVSFFGADELPETISDNLAAMTVRHLLTMTTGHAQDTVEALTRDRRMVKIFLGLDVGHEPGTVFVYNSGATYMLSAILQRLTGEKLVDYLRPRLFEPLGAAEATWQESAEGISTGGWGLSLSTESLAHFGQLLLQHGLWEGRQLVPAEWFEAATSRQVPNDNEPNPDWKQGYGFQFWRGRHGTYRGDGAFGQFCLIFPSYDAALIVTSATFDMQAILDTVWGHLLPVLEGKEVTPVARPSRLELLPPSGPAPSGGDGRTYRFGKNDAGLTAVRLDPDGTGTFTFAGFERTSDDTHDIVCAAGEWREQRSPANGTEPGQRIVTSAYGDGDAFVATLRWLDTPFVATATCRTTGDSMTVDVELNVSFGPTAFTLQSE